MISIIIVNYHVAKEIEQCIRSLARAATDVAYEVIIVDNSTDEQERQSLSHLQSIIPHSRVKIIVNNENVGFGTACNVGALQSSGEYICFLNPDVIIVDNVFPSLVSTLNVNRRNAVISPRQHSPNRWFDFSAGYFPSLILEALNIFVIGRYIEAMIMNAMNTKSVHTVDWVMGAFMLIKREIFMDIGMFDPQFFIYYEESDLCFRLQRSGYSVLYMPGMYIEHRGGVAGKRNYRFFTMHFYHSKLLFLKKSYRGSLKTALMCETYAQLFAQLILWTVLFLPFPKKALQKIMGILDVIFTNTHV